MGNVVKEGVGEGMGMRRVELKKKRSMGVGECGEVVWIGGELDMGGGLDKGMGGWDRGKEVIGGENGLKEEVRVVMDCREKEDWKLLEREMGKVLDIGEEIKDRNMGIWGVVMGWEGCYGMREYKDRMK